jgi:ketosteroid isomerase-like protein
MRNKLLTNAMLTGAIIILFAFTSCGDKTSKSADAENKTNEQSFDLAAAKKVVEEGNQSLMDLLKKGDSTGFANLYCSDAKIMAPEGPPVAGRDAIRSLIGSFVNIGLTDMSLKTIDVWGSEALVGEEGTVRFAFKDGKEYDHGKYIVLWKMEDGKWKLFRDIFNTDVAPPPAK